jgi:hypothetical protein
VKVDPALFAKYSWAGRSVKYHRSQIREVYGTGPPTEDDEDRWVQCTGIPPEANAAACSVRV